MGLHRHDLPKCLCGALLARDNPDGRCAPCRKRSRERLRVAPDVSPEFWEDTTMQEALARRHMGKVIRAFRLHPSHGRHPISQETAARWAHLSQAQLSRLEARGTSDLGRMSEWATILEVPPRYLWFSLPESRAETDAVNRRQSLKLGVALAGTPLVSLAGDPAGRRLTDDECAQWLAWELWQRRAHSLHHSDLPVPIARHLAAWTAGPAVGRLVLRDRDGSYGFAHPSFLDFYVAQRIFNDITAGDSALFAAAQTTHDTDLVIREFVARDDESATALTHWMQRAPSSVLRVNAAGVLAKLGHPQVTDSVVKSLKSHADTRQLYLTAVTSRVLELPWQQASQLAGTVERGPTQFATLLSPDQAGHAASRLAAELHNPRDGAARWCAVVLLDQLRDVSPDVAANALHTALRVEDGSETLRSVGAALAGASPISI